MAPRMRSKTSSGPPMPSTSITRTPDELSIVCPGANVPQALAKMRAPDPSGKKIWHAVLRFGDSSVFINDAFPDMGGGAKTIKLWLYSDNVDGVFARAVEAGAKVNMAPADMFWGDRMAQVSDRWGNEWWTRRNGAYLCGRPAGCSIPNAIDG